MDSLRVFDIHILKCPRATADYSKQEVKRAAKDFSNMDHEQIDKLIKTIISGLHGQEGYSLESFRSELARWNFKRNSF
jgi:hypothetical protein